MQSLASFSAKLKTELQYNIIMNNIFYYFEEIIGGILFVGTMLGCIFYFPLFLG